MQSPVRDAGPRGTQRGPMVVTALIGVVALVAVLGIALFVEPPGTAFGHRGAPDRQQQVRGNQPGSSGTVPRLHTGRMRPGHKSVSKAYLRTHFPLPRGARRDRTSHVRGVKAYRVRGSLMSTRAFYVKRLHKLGLTWTVHTIRVGGRTQAYTGTVGASNHRLYGQVSITRDLLRPRSKAVRVEVTLP